ncbi:hypothetical protein NDU88_006121 [Pleurodeles waltl]|uniref:Uncharacterized protein n=1 Tax=Pleurodeles waltl TaxID=8319 RepID=A0AAV7VNQ4_PLEWA|nr:hypothetical protein NDU88_006121 [Pleurodeles waltl]
MYASVSASITAGDQLLFWFRRQVTVFTCSKPLQSPFYQSPTSGFRRLPATELGCPPTHGAGAGQTTGSRILPGPRLVLQPLRRSTTRPLLRLTEPDPGSP